MQGLLDATFLQADMSPWIENLVILFAKGALILSATWIMAYALRSSAAAIRYMVWCTGLLSLMMLPVLSTVLPAWHPDFLPSTPITDGPVLADAPLPESEAPVPTELFVPGVAGTDVFVVAPPPPIIVDALPDPANAAGKSTSAFLSGLDFHWTVWALIVWLFGVAVAGIRLMLAHAGATMLVRKSEIVHDEDWHLLSEKISKQLGIEQFVRLRTSSWTSVPMSVGIFKPTVVLPENANEWDENQRRTVLYHELAHVKRKDCLWQLLTQMTCALYWFNPLVWVAVWQLRIERERACDDLVLTSGIDASRYAETLLQTARQLKRAEWSTLATVSMARQSQLEGRLLSILDPMRRRSLNKASGVVTVMMIAMVVVPLAVLQPASAQEAPPEVVVAPVPPVPSISIVPPKIVFNFAPVPAPSLFPAPEVIINVPPLPAPVVAPMLDFFPPEPWYDDGEVDVPVDSLTIDQIIQLRKYGIDAEFIQSIKALGYENLTYGDLLGLGKYGADAAYILSMRQAGYTSLELSDYTQMSKYGVDPEYVMAMHDAGFDNLSASDLVGMSKYGVDAGLVQTLSANGYDDLSSDDLIAASKYGVSEELIAGLAAAGYNNFSIEDLVGASKFGVSEELIAAMNSYGYKQLSGDELISASKYGVDASLLQSLHDHGYRDIPVKEIIAMSMYGVDGQYMSEMSETGLDISAGDLIRMRKYDVDAEYIKNIKKAGLEEVSVEQLIDMRKHGVDAEFIRSLKENN